jgi:hypothetical protein
MRPFFLLTILAVSCVFAEEASPIPSWSQFVTAFQKWGPEKKGMQLRAEADSESGLVSCWVRNATQNPLNYKPHALGYFLNVNVFVRQGPLWIELQRKRTAMHPMYGIGRGMNDLVRAEPLEILKSKHAYECVEERSYWRKILIGESEYQISEPRGDLPIMKASNATFYIDLAEFEWPEPLLKEKTVTLKMTQLTDFNRYDPWLEAPDFDLDTAAFKKFLAILAKPAVPRE